MTKTKFIIVFLSTLTLFLYSVIFPNKTLAAKLYFEPTSVNLTKDTQSQIKVQIDTQGASAFSADATITFPSSDMTVTVTNGGFFDNFEFSTYGNKLELHGYFYPSGDKSGDGTLALLTIKSPKDSGDGTFNFNCAGNLTVILDTNGNNILSCDQLNQLSISYTSGSQQNSGQNSPNACGGTCGSNSNCNSGLMCYQGFCRNPSCTSSVSCNCNQSPSPTAKPAPKSTTVPTPQIVTLTEFTPYPTAFFTASPRRTLVPTKQATGNSKNIPAAIGIVLLSVATVILLTKWIKFKNKAPMAKPKDEPYQNPPFPTQDPPPPPFPTSY